MCFDDPIYLDRGSFEDLMVDTDQDLLDVPRHTVPPQDRLAV